MGEFGVGLSRHGTFYQDTAILKGQWGVIFRCTTFWTTPFKWPKKRWGDGSIPIGQSVDEHSHSWPRRYGANGDSLGPYLLGTFTYRSPYISHMYPYVGYINRSHTHIWYIDILDLFEQFEHVDFNVGWFNARASPNLWVDCYRNFEPHPYPNFQTTSNCAFITISQQIPIRLMFFLIFSHLDHGEWPDVPFSFLWSLQQQYLYFRKFHQFMDRISRIFPKNLHFMIVLSFFSRENPWKYPINKSDSL